MAVGSSSLVLIEGAIAWPVFELTNSTTGFVGQIRRIYLKRMARTTPDYWADEDFIFDRQCWPPTGFHRSIYEYHAEQRPWLACDLIIERVEYRRRHIDYRPWGLPGPNDPFDAFPNHLAASREGAGANRLNHWRPFFSIQILIRMQLEWCNPPTPNPLSFPEKATQKRRIFNML